MELQQRVGAAASIEGQAELEARKPLEQGGELALHGPGDARVREALAQGVVDRQRVHHVAQVRQPDQEDTLLRGHASGAAGRASRPGGRRRVSP